MILHLIHDDKFIDMALREFEAVSPGVSCAVMLGPERTLQYVKNTNIQFRSVASAIELVSSDSIKALVLHSLSDDFLPILESVPVGKRVIWLGWGYDYYNRLLSYAYPNGLFLEKTNELMSRRPRPSYARCVLSRAKRFIKIVLGTAATYSEKTLTRIDYFIPVIDKEYDLAIAGNPWFQSKYVTWNYGTLEDDLVGEAQHVSALGDDILVGNSATPENNHLEIFEHLKNDYKLGSREIIVPLSYGDPWYRDQIILLGREMFGERFVPLTGFLPKEDYITLLNRCGNVFFNHIRQQALGNICITLLKGARMHMNPSSPLCQWFVERGAVVSRLRLDEGKRNHFSDLAPLTAEQQAINYRVVKSHWSRDEQRRRTRRLVDIALGTEHVSLI